MLRYTYVRAIGVKRNGTGGKAYYHRARARGKKHAEAIRMLGNVWLRIIVAMRRDHRLYDETTFLNAREAHLPKAR